MPSTNPRKALYDEIDRHLPNLSVPQVDLITDYAFSPLIVAGSSSSFFVNNGDVFAWGRNTTGALGNGTTDDSLIPKPALLQDCAKVNGCSNYTLALTHEGVLYAWGGKYEQEIYAKPIALKTKESFKDIALGNDFFFALTKDGRVFYCLCIQRLLSVAVAGGDVVTKSMLVEMKKEQMDQEKEEDEGIIQIAAYSNLAAFLTKNGKILEWNACFLNNFKFKDFKFIEKVQTAEKIIDIKVGGNFSLALTDKGTVLGWGSNVFGELGFASKEVSFNIPQRVPIENPVKQISAGYRHALALTTKGEALAWGDRSVELGVGPREGKEPMPMKIEGRVIQIAAGCEHSLALREDGEIYAVGINRDGELGNGTKKKSASMPVPVKQPRHLPLNLPWQQMSQDSAEALTVVLSTASQIGKLTDLAGLRVTKMEKFSQPDCQIYKLSGTEEGFHDEFSVIIIKNIKEGSENFYEVSYRGPRNRGF